MARSETPPSERPTKSAEMKFRLPSDLHAQIENAAAGHSWSASEEIRRRLEASFEAEPTADDQKTQALLAAMAEVARSLSAFYEPWHESAYSLAVLKSAVATLLTVMGPKGEPKLEIDPNVHLLDAVVDISDPPATVGRVMAMTQLTGFAKERP